MLKSEPCPATKIFVSRNGETFSPSNSKAMLRTRPEMKTFQKVGKVTHILSLNVSTVLVFFAVLTSDKSVDRVRLAVGIASFALNAPVIKQVWVDGHLAAWTIGQGQR